MLEVKLKCVRRTKNGPGYVEFVNDDAEYEYFSTNIPEFLYRNFKNETFSLDERIVIVAGFTVAFVNDDETDLVFVSGNDLEGAHRAAIFPPRELRISPRGDTVDKDGYSVRWEDMSDQEKRYVGLLHQALRDGGKKYPEYGPKVRQMEIQKDGTLVVIDTGEVVSVKELVGEEKVRAKEMARRWVEANYG